MEKEIDYLGRALASPERPFVAILGGAKVSDKVDVITNLLSKVDALIIGGAMAYTFYRAKGLPTGKSLVEEDKVDLARDILAKAAEREGEAAAAGGPRHRRQVRRGGTDRDGRARAEITDGWMALDIGPRTVDAFAAEIAKAKTVVWNGPMGCFEMKPFAAGTMAVAEGDCQDGLPEHRRRRRQRQRREQERPGRQDDAHQHGRRREPRVSRRQGAAGRGGAERQVRRYAGDAADVDPDGQ